MSELSLTHKVKAPSGANSEPAPLLLLLHGYGSNENDLIELAPYLDPRFFIISVRAPETLGPNMYAWFPLEFYQGGIKVNFQEAQSALEILHHFFLEAKKKYPINPNQIFLMGFSQGAVMSYMMSLLYPDEISGTVAMSGRVPPKEFFTQIDGKILNNFPIFACHGLYDEVISIQAGRECKEVLEKLPINLTFKEYPMGHQVTLESLQDISNWLKHQLDK